MSTHSPRAGMARDLIDRRRVHRLAEEREGWRSPEMPARYARRETAEESAVAKLFPAGWIDRRAVVASGSGWLQPPPRRLPLSSSSSPLRMQAHACDHRSDAGSQSVRWLSSVRNRHWNIGNLMRGRLRSPRGARAQIKVQEERKTMCSHRTHFENQQTKREAWRRGRDSNPGKVSLHWFSRPAL